MKLFYATNTCALFPHIVAAESGIDLQLEQVDIGKTPHRIVADASDYTQVNPKGYVPALQLADGSLLTEGVAIALYLADRAPDAKLAPPKDSPQRYRLLEWLNFISSELHKMYSPWLFHPEVGASAQQYARERIIGRLGWIDQHLAAHAYLLGDDFGVADAYAFTVIGWSKFAGIDLKPYPRLADYLHRIGERPRVREAMRAQGMALAAAA